MLKVLYLLGNTMKYGGTESYIMNYYRHIDHSRLQIDFVFQGNEAGVYDEELLQSGSKIYRLPFKSKHPFRYSKELYNILKTQEYPIVHSQMDAMGAWPLAIAQKAGVKVRIAHSHNTQTQTNSRIKLLLNDYTKAKLKSIATDYWACSELAGRWLFDDEAVEQGKVRMIHNAIEVEKFCFHQEVREQMRKELGVTDDFVIGHVGQFREQKNHRYLVDIFSEVVKKKPHSKLILVGDGPLKEEIQNKVEVLGLKDKVLFLEPRADVWKLYNCFDVFCVPSLFEGLGIILVEAQANGLQCIASKHVPQEVDMTNLITYLPIGDENIDKWIAEVKDNAIREKTAVVGKDIYIKVTEAGYDIETEAVRLQKLYFAALKD